MIGYLDLLLLLTIWFLLTADFSIATITIGSCATLLLPRSDTLLPILKDWLRVLGETIAIGFSIQTLMLVGVMKLSRDNPTLETHQIEKNNTP